MSTWWRTAKDSNGLTVVDRLDLIWRKSFYQLKEMRPYRQRILSILRRLKVCPMCKWGVVLSVRRMPSGQVEGFGRMKCPSCNGTGRVRREG